MDEKKQNDQIQLFENQKIRTAWDAEQEEWYFSVVDVVGMLVYSGGGSFGPPVIHLGPAALGGHEAEYEELFRLYGSRMASKALELFSQS